MELAAGGHKDSVGCIKHLLHAGADVNALGSKGCCTLHSAAAAFSKDVVQVLLSSVSTLFHQLLISLYIFQVSVTHSIVSLDRSCLHKGKGSGS